jgi:hypothetical protein
MHILLTGAASGLGRGLALNFVNKGHRPAKRPAPERIAVVTLAETSGCHGPVSRVLQTETATQMDGRRGVADLPASLVVRELRYHVTRRGARTRRVTGALAARGCSFLLLRHGARERISTCRSRCKNTREVL